MEKQNVNCANDQSGEMLFPDVATGDDFEAVASYFGSACFWVDSVYHNREGHLYGEVRLFVHREVFYFEMMQTEGSLYLTGLWPVQEVFR